MSKLNKSLIVTTIILFLVSGFSIYFAFNCWQDEKAAQDKVTELTNKIEQLEQNITKNNQIIAQREKEKAQDAISIKQLNERIKDALKNNQCANEYMPSNVSDWMRNGKN
ncbi:hypothetical protein A9G13_02095 [Gilliamella sp. wkB178]|uniref:DUF2570 domain-containing protein n=1 Tax=Gilliamella sp. wkB178 TaxID=3120259 RepID=UPI00080E7884|nr:DUF2570 domain-containing protein [Gilliamella apicola]OCG08876.1 hypothetical protein A9G13_02095 [Gilliamella apicola]